MSFPSDPRDLVPLAAFSASALIVSLLAIALGRRRDRPGVRYFAMLLWIESAYSVFLVCEFLSTGLQGKIFWDNLQLALSLGAGASLFLFARRLLGPQIAVPRWNGLPYFLPAIASGILAFTDPVHGLIRSAPFLDTSVPSGELVYGFTVIDYLLFAYTFGLSALAIGLLIRDAAGARAPDRRKYALVILGFMIPAAGWLPTMLDVRIQGRRDWSPIWFAIGALPIYIALFRYRLFDILPLAWRTLVESMGDPVLVFDDDLILLDCNRSFAGLLGATVRESKGRSLADIFAAWPKDARGIFESSAVSPGGAELPESPTICDPTGERCFRIKVSSIPGEGRDSGTELCKVALFRDVTEITAVEKQLQAWNGQLEGRIAARIADLEREVSRRKAAEEGLRRVSEKIIGSQREILVTLSEVVENRSPETANHVLRVGEYSRILATAYGLSPEGVALVADAAPLHDVGKIAISDSILNKNGFLSGEEMSEMKRHSAIGYQILSSSRRSIIRAAAIIALDHHERWNGEGYPSGKAGESISLSGRIVCLCDVFDALATERPYKKPWAIPDILEYFRAESGHMFDPRLVELFFANQDRFREVALRFPEVS